MRKNFILILFFSFFIGCSNKNINNNSFKTKKSIERMNYMIQVPLIAREISYSIGSGKYIEKEKFALDEKGAFFKIEVRADMVKNIKNYIREDLSPIIDDIQILERKEIYINDYIGEEISFLFENEIKKKVVYLPNKTKIYILTYQAPYKFYTNYLNAIDDSLFTLKTN